MRNLRGIVALAAAAALLLTGCQANTTDQAGAPDAAGDGGTRTIVDHTGGEVTIPANIERVAFDQIPIASTYLAYFGGSAPNLVGMSKNVLEGLRNTVAVDMAPEILDVDTSYYDNGELNVETLLTLEPDVVFYNARNTEHGAQFAAAGIPAVGFSTTGDPATVYADWLRLLEQVFDEPGKMDTVVAHGEQLVSQARERSATIPEADRKNVLIIYNYSAGKLMVAGEPEFFGSYWLDTANATNAAVGTTEALAPVTTEQVIAWNPDTILIAGAGQSGITPQEVLDGTADGLDLSSLTAVQEGRVYSTGLGMWSWFTPNPDAPLVANWIGDAVYPQLAEDEEIRAMTKEYYEVTYGYELSDAQVDRIYTSSFANA